MKPILLIIFSLIPGLCISSELPAGWELTTSAQYSKEFLSWLKGTIPNTVAGDFNGDQIPDTAWLLTNKRKTKLGLFVSISTGRNTSKIIKLFESSNKGNVFVGITHLKPGKYKTACGKGYWKCAKGEKPFLYLTTSGIEIYRFESGSSVYVWNKTKFDRVWFSD